MLSVGHGNASAEEFDRLLSSAGVGAVVDVRRYPGSRRHPWFGKEALRARLEVAGVRYHPMEALGGRRRPDPDSPNGAWRVAQFAAYADHMATEEFARGIERLGALAEQDRIAVMCSESLWWRCHRRLIADHLVLIEGLVVEHLFHDGRREPHRPMDRAVVAGDVVTYPG